MRARALAPLLGIGTLVLALPGAAPAAAATSQLIAVVVDFGPGGPAPIVKCVDVSGQADASDVTALGQAVGLGQVGFNESGLLCQIAGYPSGGCRPGGPPYAYWAYFQGTAAGWSYASTGPVSHLANPASAVGFRFEPQGTGMPGDPTPSASSNPAVDCPASAPSPTAVPTPTNEPAPAPVSLGASAPSTTIPKVAPAPTTSTPSAPRGPSRVRMAAASVTAAPGGGSPAAPAIAAIGAFAVVGLVAGVLVRRRRRAA